MDKIRGGLQAIEYGIRHEDTQRWPLSDEDRAEIHATAMELQRSASPRVKISAVKCLIAMDLVNAKREATRVAEKSSDQSIAMAMLREQLRADPALLASLAPDLVRVEAQAEPAASWAGWGKGDAPSDQGGEVGGRGVAPPV